MSLQVNFTAHGHDLRAAYEAILRPAEPQTSDNWAMFGYDKGTNDLKVLGQGNGGLEELEDEFADGKIQYAFVRIIDPNTQLNKFILIGWCGDGVPESKKGLFNSHLADVSLFLKGYHLQINARCEADVTPAQILKRVNEGSGSKYSIHNETHKAERITPLQSAYKRTEIPDIAALQRNPTKPEPAPKYGLGASKPFGSTSPSTPPTSKPESRSWNSPAASPSSAASPPSSSTERSWKTSGGSSYSASSSGASFNKVAPPSSLLNYGASTPNEPSMNKAQQIRMEREAREKEERERIKKEIEASENRERQAQGQSSAQKQAEERRLQEQQEREREQEAEQQRSQDRAREERAAREREEREAADKAEEAARSAREAFKAREEVLAREQASKADEEKRQQEQLQRQREKDEKEADERRLKQQREEEEAQEREYQRQQQEEQEKRRKQQQQEEEEEEQRRAQYEEEERRLQEEHAASAAAAAAAAATAAQVEPAQAEALGAPGSVSAVVLYSYEKAEENEMSLIEGEVILNVTELDVGWWSGESTDGSRSGLFPANYVEVIEQAEEHPAVAAVAEEPHHVQEAATTNGHATVDEVPSGQPSAVALYDYTAGEPNEISFLEGDVITSIEFVTDDWWSGTSTQGANGLFPSNYVELHQ